MRRNSLNCIVTALALIFTSAAGAQTPQTPPAQLARQLGDAIVHAAHPTADDAQLVSQRVEARDTKVTWFITMACHGAFTGFRYTSYIEIDYSRSNWRVEDVRYRDNAIVPYDAAAIRRAVDAANRQRGLD